MPPPYEAALPLRVQLDTVRAPLLLIAPPNAPEPNLMLRPLSAAEAPPLTRKTCRAWAPLTVTSAAPGPWTVVVAPSVRVSGPLVSVIVLLVAKAVGSKVMVLGPPRVLAWVTAQRSEPVPLSSVLNTMRPTLMGGLVPVIRGATVS